MFTCGNTSNPVCSGECILYFTLGAEDFRVGCVTYWLENMSMLVLSCVHRACNRYVGHRTTITSGYHGWDSSLFFISDSRVPS